MRASKMRVASKSARVATSAGRNAASKQSSTGMSSSLRGALATVVLLGTVVLLMSSSLRQVSQTAILDAPSALRRPALTVMPAAPVGVPLEQPEQASTGAVPSTEAADVMAKSEVPNHGGSSAVPLATLRGRVDVEAAASQVEAAPLRISAGHSCAPPAESGAGRLAWAAIRNRTSLLPRGCAGEAGEAGELCRLAQAVAGDAGELLLLVGVGTRTASLSLTLRSAARALGGGRLLLLALDADAARLGANARVPTFLVSGGVPEAQAAPLAARLLLRAGLWVVLSAGSSALFMADPFGGLARDADVEVLSEGWDEVTTGGHIHGIGDEAMGWSQYSESLRISHVSPSLVALAPTPHAVGLLRRLAASPAGLSSTTLTEQLFGPSFDSELRGGVQARRPRLRPRHLPATRAPS